MATQTPPQNGKIIDVQDLHKLSGVFFPGEAMPEILRGVTDYLSLTYPAEARRRVATDGATLWSQWLNLVGLAAWLAISFVLAVRLFWRE